MAGSREPGRIYPILQVARHGAKDTFGGSRQNIRVLDRCLGKAW